MIEITDREIDVKEVIASVAAPEAGAIVPFIGTVRKEPGIRGLFYEVHERMASQILREIAEAAAKEWPTEGISIVHRVGWVPVGEASVVIAVSAPHRKEAFAACRMILERLKEEVPIWKRKSER